MGKRKAKKENSKDDLEEIPAKKAKLRDKENMPSKQLRAATEKSSSSSRPSAADSKNKKLSTSQSGKPWLADRADDTNNIPSNTSRKSSSAVSNSRRQSTTAVSDSNNTHEEEADDTNYDKPPFYIKNPRRHKLVRGKVLPRDSEKRRLQQLEEQLKLEEEENHREEEYDKMTKRLEKYKQLTNWLQKAVNQCEVEDRSKDEYQYKYKCTFCPDDDMMYSKEYGLRPRGYYDKDLLRAHLYKRHIVVKKSKAFKCIEDGCNKDFSSLQNLDNHMKERHGKDDDQVNVCNICGFRTVREERLNDHMKIHLTRNQQNQAKKAGGVRCSTCGAGFSNYRTMFEHIIMVHKYRENSEVKPGEARHECNYCFAPFKRIADRETHIIQSHPEKLEWLKEEKRAEEKELEFMKDNIDNVDLILERKLAEMLKRIWCSWCGTHFEAVNGRRTLRRHFGCKHVAVDSQGNMWQMNEAPPRQKPVVFCHSFNKCRFCDVKLEAHYMIQNHMVKEHPDSLPWLKEQRNAIRARIHTIRTGEDLSDQNEPSGLKAHVESQPANPASQEESQTDGPENQESSVEPDNNLVEIYVPCMKKEEGESEHSEVDDNLEELAGAVVVPHQVAESLEQVAAELDSLTTEEKRKKKKKKKSKDKEINATIDSINDSIEVFAGQDPDGAAVEPSEPKENKKKKKKDKEATLPNEEKPSLDFVEANNELGQNRALDDSFAAAPEMLGRDKFAKKKKKKKVKEAESRTEPIGYWVDNKETAEKRKKKKKNKDQDMEETEEPAKKKKKKDKERNNNNNIKEEVVEQEILDAFSLPSSLSLEDTAATTTSTNNLLSSPPPPPPASKQDKEKKKKKIKALFSPSKDFLDIEA